MLFKRKKAQPSQEDVVKRVIAQTEQTLKRNNEFLAMSQNFSKATEKMLERR